VTESSSALQLAYHISRSRLGRRRLARVTGLSEMAVRIELERLRERRLIRLDHAGVELTDEGRPHFAPLLDRIREIRELHLTSLRLGAVALAAHITTQERTAAWLLRDLAVREGATGLLLLSWSCSEWRFAHDEEPIRLRNPKDAEAITQVFPNPEDADRLVVAFGPARQQAGLGLWHVLTELAST